MSIHFDRRVNPAAYRKIRAALVDNPAVTFARRRVKCGWGEWSLVLANLNAVRAAVEAFPAATHFYMLSGDCMPIKSARYGMISSMRNVWTISNGPISSPPTRSRWG